MIVLVAVLPMLFFAAVLASHMVQSKAESNQRQLTRAAEDLALAVDQEITATVRILNALAMSSSLRTNDLIRFHSKLRQVLKTQPSWSSIRLHNHKGEWLLSALMPFGSKLGSDPEPQSLKEVLQTGAPKVGRLKHIPKTLLIPTEHAFAVSVPVNDPAGKVKYVLSAILSTIPIQELTSRGTPVPGEWVRSVVDSDGSVVGRSRDPETYVGKKASDQMRRLLEESPSGLKETTTLDNVRVYTAFFRAPYSGWHSIVSAQAHVLESQAVHTRRVLGLAAILILLFSSASVFAFSRWMRRLLRSVADGAASLARGDDPRVDPSNVQEVEELRHSLESASVLLKSRDRAKSDFLANMSHELRTPLGIVLGMSDLISKHLVPPQELDRSWAIIKRNGEQLLHLIDDILDMSKIEAKRLVIEHFDFSIVDLISSIVKEFVPQAHAKGIEVILTSDVASDVMVNSDPVRLRQIIVNLVGNAVKFTQRGEVRVHLHAIVDKRIQISVSDTGIGLSSDQQKFLFNDFTQGDGSHSRKYGGTGLGLSLSRKLARLLGGDVVLAKSQLGEGSKFQVVVQGRALEGKRDDIAVAERSVPVKANFEGLQILLAEDSPDNVILIQSYLRGTGAKITVVQNGREAIELAQQKHFDLILMDIQMPELDGYEAARILRESGNRVPIVALTAHALGEHRERALQTGFSDFITKPIEQTLLSETIERQRPASL